MSDAAVHIVCPHCTGINRVPKDKLEANGRCGKCHQALFEGRPVELTEASFSRHLAHSDIPLLVDFWAAWCGPCQMMAPVFAQAAQELEPRLRLAKVDTEREHSISAQYGIRGIPTMILFKSGQETTRLSGALDLPRLLSWVEQHL